MHPDSSEPRPGAPPGPSGPDQRQPAPTVIAIGGVPGAGKSTVARRLAAELGVACLAPDPIGQTIRDSQGIRDPAAVDAAWIAYDIVFGLCEDLTRGGLSVVLDLNLGWRFQWEWLDAFSRRAPGVRQLPILLRCPRAICLERIERRHAQAPAAFDPPELFRNDPKLLAVWDFLENLECADTVVIDASRSADEVYAAVKQAVLAATAPSEPPAGWMPRERWQALVRGESCPLCVELAEPDRPNPHGFPVAELGLSRLRLAANQAVPGYCVLICRRHVREPFELPPDEQLQYWQDLMRAGQAIETVFQPTKLNFQILGNLVPHLHTHIVPRVYGDPAPGRPLYPGYATHLLDAEAAAVLVERLRAALETQ